jgi:hypothetical protein
MLFAIAGREVGHRIVGLFTGLCLLLSLANTAVAQDECATNFKAEGDPRNGASYGTFVTIANLDPHSALGQMEKFALEQGFKIGAENYSGTAGTLSIVQKDSNNILHPHKGFPILIEADGTTNRLAMALQLNQGQTAKPEDVRSSLCGMLTKVTMDSSGAALAAQAHAQTHSDEIINIKASDLAAELRKAMIGHVLHPDNVGDQYIGRTYRIDGRVFISATDFNRALDDVNGAQAFNIQYITDKTSLLGGKVEQGVAIGCHTDPSQRDRFRALRNDDFATLIGKVTQWAASGISGGTLYLECRFEN